jgi:hypothetical protein
LIEEQKEILPFRDFDTQTESFVRSVETQFPLESELRMLMANDDYREKKIMKFKASVQTKSLNQRATLKYLIKQLEELKTLQCTNLMKGIKLSEYLGSN